MNELCPARPLSLWALAILALSTALPYLRLSDCTLTAMLARRAISPLSICDIRGVEDMARQARREARAILRASRTIAVPKGDRSYREEGEALLLLAAFLRYTAELAREAST